MEGVVQKRDERCEGGGRGDGRRVWEKSGKLGGEVKKG